MQREFKQVYFNLTRDHPLPSNCLPLTAKHNQSESLVKLLQINQHIMDLLDPGASAIFNKKKDSKAQILHFQRNAETDRNKIKRIHQNISYFASTINPISERRKFSLRNSVEKKSVQEGSNHQIVKSRDIYDDRIEKYMTSKYEKEEIIEKYLKNREQFVKEACKQIESEIKLHDSGHKKNGERKRSKQSARRLPKIKQFTSIMLKKSGKKIENADYIHSINHLRKAQLLDHKNRERNQRVFRRKMHSLQYRLDKIRDENDV